MIEIFNQHQRLSIFNEMRFFNRSLPLINIYENFQITPLHSLRYRISKMIHHKNDIRNYETSVLLLTLYFYRT